MNIENTPNISQPVYQKKKKQVSKRWNKVTIKQNIVGLMQIVKTENTNNRKNQKGEKEKKI